MAVEDDEDGVVGPGAKGVKANFFFKFLRGRVWGVKVQSAKRRGGNEWGEGVDTGVTRGSSRNEATKKHNAPSFIPDRFLNGESRSMATMPMLKICTPPPDMYSMNACMGKDLTGEIAKSQAFLVFKSSYEFTAEDDEDLLLLLPPDAFP